MSSVSSLLATAVAAIMPFAGSTGPVDAQEQLSQPDPAENAQTAPVEAGEQPAQDQQPGAHAEKGRITGDKEDVINGDAEGAEEVDPGSTVATCRAVSWPCSASWRLLPRRPATSS